MPAQKQEELDMQLQDAKTQDTQVLLIAGHSSAAIGPPSGKAAHSAHTTWGLRRLA